MNEKEKNSNVTGDDCVNFTAGKDADTEKSRSTVTDIWIFDNYFGHGM